MILKRLAPAVCIALALMLAAPAQADDEAPAPRKVRVKLKKAPQKQAVAKSPAATIHKWLQERLASELTGAGDGGALEQWFAGGADVPMAGLRDALAADGWNAQRLRGWMVGEAASTLPRLAQAFGRLRQGTSGAQFGPMLGHLFGSRKGSQGSPGQACPHCGGQGPQHGQGGRSFRGRGLRGMRRGGMRGFGRGPRGMGGFGRGGMGGFGRGPGGMGQGGFGPRAQQGSSQQGWLLWNDGTGWHRQPLPGTGTTQGGGPDAARIYEMLRRRMQPRQGGPGRGHGPMPEGGPAHREHRGLPKELEQMLKGPELEKLLEWLKRQGAVDALPWMAFPREEKDATTRTVRVKKVEAPKKVRVKALEVKEVQPAR